MLVKNLSTKRFITVLIIPHHLCERVLTAMQQTLLLPLPPMLHPKLHLGLVITHPPLKQYQSTLSNIQKGAVYDEVLLPECYGLFPCQPCDKLVSLKRVDKVKCPKINNKYDIVNVYICQLNKLH